MILGRIIPKCSSCFPAPQSSPKAPFCFRQVLARTQHAELPEQAIAEVAGKSVAIPDVEKINKNLRVYVHMYIHRKNH